MEECIICTINVPQCDIVKVCHCTMPYCKTCIDTWISLGNKKCTACDYEYILVTKVAGIQLPRRSNVPRRKFISLMCYMLSSILSMILTSSIILGGFKSFQDDGSVAQQFPTFIYMIFVGGLYIYLPILIYDEILSVYIVYALSFGICIFTFITQLYGIAISCLFHWYIYETIITHVSLEYLYGLNINTGTFSIGITCMIITFACLSLLILIFGVIYSTVTTQQIITTEIVEVTLNSDEISISSDENV